MTWTNALGVRQFNVVLLGNLVAGGLRSPGVNKYEATLTACTCLGPLQSTCLYHTSKYTTPRPNHHLLVAQREVEGEPMYGREWSSRNLTVGRHCEQQLNLWSSTQVAHGIAGTVQLN